MSLIQLLPPLALVLVLGSALVSSAEEPCHLPDAWLGEWYWKGNVFNITDTELGSQRRCLRRDHLKLLIQQERARRRCYTCVVVFVRHSNIIEFKESRVCSERPSLRQLCRTIAGDAPLHTMIRVRPRPEPCPFRGRFTFAYRRSEKVCAEPVSRAWSCASPWSLVLQHQACPDVAGAERLSETLTCLATWRNHDTHFMVGRLDSVKTKTDADRYRCFIYQRFDSSGEEEGGGGYHVVQSGDATCQGLQSVYDGHKVINLYDDRQSVGKCHLPDWFVAHREWHNMDGTQQYHVYHRNQSIRVTYRQRPSASEPTSNRTVKLVCSSVLQSSEKVVKLVLHRSHDCTSGYQCALLYKRDGHVAEIKLGEMTHSPDTACQYFDESRHNFSTLVSSSLAGHPCPYIGHHAVIGVKREGRTVRDTCSGGLSTLVMGCSSSDTLQLRSQCQQQTSSKEYRCHGHWKEGDTHFLVTSSVEESPERSRRVCFVSMATAQGLVFSTLQEACYRNMSVGSEGSLAFNVTIDGDCRAEASTTRSSGARLAASAVGCLISCLLRLLR